jgi:hypothetical protein
MQGLSLTPVAKTKTKQQQQQKTEQNKTPEVSRNT